MTTRTDAIHDALTRLAGYEYLDGAGFACHGTMGAEALSNLGHDDEVAAWVDRYTASHAPIDAPPQREAIALSDDRSWRAALGDFARVGNWHAAFDRALLERPWTDVLADWVPRLLSGYGGGLTHGLLRTSHAIRALPDATPPSPLALDELAKGLASWAAWYRALPGEPHLRGHRSLDDALRHVPRPAGRWTPIEAGTLSRLDELDGFAQAVEALGPPPDPGEALSDLSAAFCTALVTHRDAMPMGLVHTVTPIAAIRTLLDVVPGLSIGATYARLWQVGAALLAGFTTTDGHQPANQPTVRTRDELAARAAAHGDVHVIKFTEACLREHARRPDPVYLIAAAELHARVAMP